MVDYYLLLLGAFCSAVCRGPEQQLFWLQQLQFQTRVRRGHESPAVLAAVNSFN